MATDNQIKAYEKYKLWWMMRHGYTALGLFLSVWYHHESNIDPDNGDFGEEDFLQLNPDDLFKTWENDAGFNGEIWPCLEEFLETEYRRPELMSTILTHSEYRIYFNEFKTMLRGKN